MKYIMEKYEYYPPPQEITAEDILMGLTKPYVKSWSGTGIIHYATTKLAEIKRLQSEPEQLLLFREVEVKDEL